MTSNSIRPEILLHIISWPEFDMALPHLLGEGLWWRRGDSNPGP